MAQSAESGQEQFPQSPEEHHPGWQCLWEQQSGVQRAAALIQVERLP